MKSRYQGKRLWTWRQQTFPELTCSQDYNFLLFIDFSQIFDVVIFSTNWLFIFIYPGIWWRYLNINIYFSYLLFPTWYTNRLFVYINYIKLDSSTCFERTPPIIRRSTVINYCIVLVDSVECLKVHGPTNPKFMFVCL